MMHRKRFRMHLGGARPVTGLAFLVLFTMLVLALVAKVDDRVSAWWSPLSPLESPVTPTLNTSPAEESLTPTARPPEATQAKVTQTEPTLADPVQTEATGAAPGLSEAKQGPAWRSLLGIGLVALGLGLVIGGVFWLARRQ